LSNLTRELNKNPAISEDEESVASMGFNLAGFVDVARCRVDAKSSIDKKNNKKNFKGLLYDFIIYNKF
jgi:hypothetical protein